MTTSKTKTNIKEFVAAKTSDKGYAANDTDMEATVMDVSLPRTTQLQNAQEVEFPDKTKHSIKEKQIIDLILTDGSCTDKVRFSDWNAMLPILWGAPPARSYKIGDVIRIQHGYRQPGKEQDGKPEIRLSKGSPKTPAGTVEIIGHQDLPAAPAAKTVTIATSKWARPVTALNGNGKYLADLYAVFDKYANKLVPMLDNAELEFLEKIEKMPVKDNFDLLKTLYDVFDRRSTQIIAANFLDKPSIDELMLIEKVLKE